MNLAKISQMLNKPGLNWVLSLAISIRSSLFNRQLIFIYPAGKSMWVHRSRCGVYINSEPKVVNPLNKRLATSDDYYCTFYRPNNGDTVIDVGAGIGIDVLLYSRLAGDTGKVIAVEAHPETYACLKKMCELNGLNNVVLINKAITRNNEPIFIEDTDQHIGNSIDAESGIRVEGCTMDNLLSELAIHKVDFLKMNIEGAEKLAIESMEHSIKITEHVCIACHDFKADRTGNEFFRTREIIQEYLNVNNFEVFEHRDPRPWANDHIHAANKLYMG